MRLHEREAHPGTEQELLAAEPSTDWAMAMVLDAWRRLESERPLGFGAVGLIPVLAVIAWAAFRRLDRDLTEMLIDVIQKLDADRAERDAAARALKDGG